MLIDVKSSTYYLYWLLIAFCKFAIDSDTLFIEGSYITDWTVSEVYLILFTNMMLSTLLIRAACRMRAIRTSWQTSLIVESLWLTDRTSERGIRRSEVRFLMRPQNFFLCPLLVTRLKTYFTISLPSSKLIISLISIVLYVYKYYFMFSK